eukprot:CAMPEP_0175708036 /NCGR_PEP_ID=MMETSP0097-20121207/38863_1 /TAXON_ID=311494 /ORGANISM="Alexandrium monilatum, Strain CCMP3105" /LENGTH=237 /DNA_ID=CAMNT_0017015419 /DNA_START=129 /DNA_END=838 /DNA_ORIENTATION=-
MLSTRHSTAGRQARMRAGTQDAPRCEGTKALRHACTHAPGPSLHGAACERCRGPGQAADIPVLPVLAGDAHSLCLPKPTVGLAHAYAAACACVQRRLAALPARCGEATPLDHRALYDGALHHIALRGAAAAWLGLRASAHARMRAVLAASVAPSPPPGRSQEPKPRAPGPASPCSRALPGMGLSFAPPASEGTCGCQGSPRWPTTPPNSPETSDHRQPQQPPGLLAPPPSAPASGGA